MRLVRFIHEGATRIGRQEGEEVVDLSAAVSGLPPGDMCAFLEAGEEAIRRAASVSGPRIRLEDVELRAPVARPPKILAVALNYADHAAETKQETPEFPTLFNKQSTAVAAPGEPVHIPRASEKVDYEGELAFVMGRRCRHVPRERAHEVIAGYTIANDVSVRDWQLRVKTMTMGKSFDTHCPLGPSIVTADELEEFGGPSGLGIKTWVNGELRQNSNTKELIFDCFDLVAHLTTAFTLEPGDVISTGTPSGVAIARKPRVWLRAGDVVRIEIDGLGALENPFVNEPESTTLI